VRKHLQVHARLSCRTTQGFALGLYPSATNHLAGELVQTVVGATAVSRRHSPWIDTAMKIIDLKIHAEEPAG
jgi:hypothetical protein